MISDANESREQLLQVLTEDIHDRLSISECLLFGSTLRKYYDGTITEAELNEEVSSILASYPDLLQRFPIFKAQKDMEDFPDNPPISQSVPKSEPDYSNMECLHDLLSSFDPGVEHVQKLLQLKPDSIEALDMSHKLPLHTACIRGVSLEVIQVLIDAYPIAVSTRDDMGRLPLHYYVTFVNSEYSDTSLSTQFLNLCMRKKFCALSAQAIILLGANDFLMEKDHEGFTPFKNFAYECYMIERNDKESDAKAKKIIDAFLGGCRPVRGEFLDTVRTFPYYMVKYIANDVRIRKHLNEEAINAFYFGTIILDLFFRIIICILFLQANHNAINNTMDGQTRVGHDQNDLIILYILYFGSLYLFIRVGTRLMSFLEVNDIVQWSLDGFHWIQLIESVLVFMSVLLIHLNPDKYNHLNVIATFASGIQWISILVILKPASLHFSLFLRGFINVVKTLVPFVLSSSVILFAFASMFYITSYDMDKCNPRSDAFMPCTFTSALDMVVNNFANSQINEESFRFDPEYTILSFLFSMVVIILQLNILIAVVTDSFVDIGREGRECFWLDRLYYTSESYCLKKMVGCINCFPVSDDFEERHQASMAKRWDVWYMRCFCEKRRKTQARQKLGLQGQKTLIQRMSSTIKPIVLAFLLFLWIIFGFITCGYFLPRQVREYFVFEEVDEKENIQETVMSHKEMLVMVSKEVKKQVKVSSTILQKEIRSSSKKLDIILDSLPDLLMNNATE